MPREKKTLPCGCVMERYSPTGKWYVIRLCQQHVFDYYKDPDKILAELRKLAKESEE